MQAVMLEKALFKVPHESGWFETDSKHAELGSSDDEPVEFKGNSIDEKDDDYKAINWQRIQQI